MDRNEAGARQVATETGARVQVGGVSDSAFCDAVVAATLAQYGRLEVLVNAAGIVLRASGVETTDEQWQRIMGVSVSGAFLCAGPLLGS